MINAALEMAFELAPKPTNDEMLRISKKAGMELGKVHAWYQKRMACGATSASGSSSVPSFDPTTTQDSAYGTITGNFASMSSQSISGQRHGSIFAGQKYAPETQNVEAASISMHVARLLCTFFKRFRRRQA